MNLHLKFQRVAILGSNSFAGRCLSKLMIEQGREVLGISRSPQGSEIFFESDLIKRKNFRFLQADLNSHLDTIVEELNQWKPTVIFDLAGQGMVAESWENPEQWYQTNIVAKTKLQKLLLSSNFLERYVRVSTPEVYGHSNRLLSESWEFKPSTPYAVSHAAADMTLKIFHTEYGFPVVFTRFANFYGPRQQLYRIIPRAIVYGYLNRRLGLDGGGKSVRSFIYGDDVAVALQASAEVGKVGEIYHFTSGHFLTIRSVVELICDQLQIPIETLCFDQAERPGKDLAYLMNADKALTELGWKPATVLEDGIAATIRWVSKHINQIQALPLYYEHRE